MVSQADTHRAWHPMPLGLGVLCHHSMGLLNGDYFQVVDVLGAGKRWRPRTSAARSGRAGPGRVDGRGEREDGAAPIGRGAYLNAAKRARCLNCCANPSARRTSQQTRCSRTRSRNLTLTYQVFRQASRRHCAAAPTVYDARGT